MRSTPLLLATVLLLAACGSKTTVYPGGVSVEEGDSMTKIVTSAGTLEFTDTGEGETATMPEDFPSDIPLMSEMKLTRSSAMRTNEGTLFGMSWETTVGLSEVMNSLEKALKAEGWEVSTLSYDKATGDVVFSEKASDGTEARRGGIFHLEAQDSMTMISFTFNQPK